MPGPPDRPAPDRPAPDRPAPDRPAPDRPATDRPAPDRPAHDGGNRYRIDDLARQAGTTVRNVRAYQDRGLLPAPERVGRVGWYSDSHLARLRLIGEMLSRGYTLSNIGELIDGWVKGQNLSDVLGLEAALIAPWGDDRSESFTRDELRELFGRLGPDYLSSAIQIGLVRPEGERFRVADPRFLEGARLLMDAGVPAEVVVDLGARIATATDEIARMYVEIISRYVVGGAGEAMAPADVRRITEVVARLRPLAKDVVDAGLSAALDRRIGAEMGAYLERSGLSGEGTVTPAG